MEVDGERGVGAGRRVRTARSLQQGEVVLSEPALVTGPRLSSVLVCVSCCSRLTLLTPVPCPTCGLPLCSSCHSAPANHSRECLIFSNNNIHFSFKTTSQAKLISPVVTIIRLLLSQNWTDLESNLEKRRGSKSWNYVEKHLVPILTTLKDRNGNHIFKKEDIHLAAGVLDTNCFEVNTEDKFGRSLFLSAAMFNNHCYPNCVRRISEGNIEIINVRPVPAGEELTICYTDLLSPLPARQTVFRVSKHFTCHCSRCSTSAGDQESTSVEQCEELVARSRWSCWGEGAGGGVMSRLLSLLPPDHHLVLQWRDKILHHLASCLPCREPAEREIARARRSLLSSSLDLDTFYRYR